MAGGWNVKTGSGSRELGAACGCGSPGFSHYPSLHPGRDQPSVITEEQVSPEDLTGYGVSEQRPNTSSSP